MSTTVSFTVDLTDPVTAYTPLATVGRTYEVGINGVGYMLLDRTDIDPELKYRRTTIPLDPQRFATGSTPFTEAIQHYSFFALDDYRGGAGQRFASRETSDLTRFYDSDGVDPLSVSGQVTLLHATNIMGHTYTALRGVVVGTRLYLQTGAKTISYYDTVGAFPTGSFTIAAATTISDLTTDGVYWYAACGAAGIFRNNSAADPGAAWSAQVATVLGFQASRICAGVLGAGSTTPNVFTTLNSAGAEEVANGRITLTAGTTITNFTGGTGFVWFGAYAGDRGWVYKWNITATTPSGALEMLPGYAVRSIFYGQGQVAVRAEQRSTATAAKATIYRCPVDATTGNLTPFAIVELNTPSTTDHGGGTFGADGDKIFFSWNDMDGATGTDGLGAMSLSSGGYCKWHKGGIGGSTAQVRQIFRWQNRLCFTVDGVGIFYETPTAFLASGTLTTSVYDLGSTLAKVYDFITLVGAPLAASEFVGVEYSVDFLGSFLAFTAANLTGTSTSRKQTFFARKSESLALRLTLNGPGTTTPTLYIAQVRLHAHGLADTLIELPVNCGDHISGLQGGQLSENAPGAGAARARALEALETSRVLFQDLDYATTLTTEVYEVVQVDVRSYHMPGRHKGSTDILQAALLTMRKATR